MNFFKEIQQSVNEGPLDAVRARMDARRDHPEKQSPNPTTPLPPVPPYVAPTKPAELKAGDIIGYRPKNAKMVPIKAKVLKLLSGDRAMVSVSSPTMIARNNDSPVITIGPLSDLDIQNPYKAIARESVVNEAAVDWLPAYNGLVKGDGEPAKGGNSQNLNWKKSMALVAKDTGITDWNQLADFVQQYASNGHNNASRDNYARLQQLTNEIASLMKQAPTMDEMRDVVKQQGIDKHQQNLTAIQQQLDLENAPLQHELSVQALINKAELDQADQKELLELDMEARLAIIKIKQDLELDAKERLTQIEREIEDRKEREDVRRHELELAQAGYKHELAVINVTAEGEYKKAKLEADYQIQIKQLDNIDNAGERQNRLDQINADKAKQIAIIDSETKAKVTILQKEVDVEKQQSDIKIEQAFMMTLNPIWGAALTAAHAAGATWKAGINNLNKALAMLSKPIMPKPQKEAVEGQPQMKQANTFQAKPMAVSLDYWKKAVLARYPNAKFATERRPNGSTLAGELDGRHGMGGLGIYSPSTGLARVGPEGKSEPLRIHPKQGVGEASKPDAYQRDEINATSGFGKNSQAYRADGGANDEDHEGDARREKQEKSGTWYIRLNGKLIKDKAGNPYSFHGKAAANKAALTMQAKLFNQGKEFMLTTNPNDKSQGVAEGAPELLKKEMPTHRHAEKLLAQNGVSKDDPDYHHHLNNTIKHLRQFGNIDLINKSDKQGVAEGEEHSPVASAITRRIMLQRHDLLSKYGPVLVTQAIDEVADFVGDVEEIGSSDVSGWIKQVEQMLANNPAEAFGEDVAEASLSQMRDYFNQPDDSMSVGRAPARTGKPNASVPQEIQNLINKMYHSGKVTPEEFKVLQDFQRKTKINVGIKEATTGNAGYDSMLAVMKAVDAGQDATFDLGGEPITLDYNEARFLAGRYKAFLKAGRQEEFLKYMENPVAFDRLMKQLRDLMDKQKNFKGSVQGERGVEESTVEQAEVIESQESLPQVDKNQYWCQIDSTAKLIPEGYKKLASGYITKVLR